MPTIKLLSDKGLPVSGEASKLRERKAGELVHHWKDKGEEDINGYCYACHVPLGRLSGLPWVESEDRWRDHPAKCGDKQ